MTCTKRMFSAILCCTVAVLGVWHEASASQAGGGPYAFLRIGMGGRGSGLGGAYTALADDGTSPYWNPAGLGFLKTKRSVTFMMNQTSAEPGAELGSHMFFSLAWPKPNLWGVRWIPGLGWMMRTGTVALTFVQFSVADIQETQDDGFGEPIFLSTFSSSQTAFMLSYGVEALAVNQAPALHAGFSIKYMTHSIGTFGSASPSLFIGGMDFGVEADASAIMGRGDRAFLWLFKEIRLGLMARKNFDKKWDNGRVESDPLSLALGYSSKLLKGQRFEVLWAMDLHRETNGPTAMANGLELRLVNLGTAVDLLAVRVGMRDRYLTGTGTDVSKADLNVNSKLTFGAGVRTRFAQVDFAYVQGGFQNQIRLSLSALF